MSIYLNCAKKKIKTNDFWPFLIFFCFRSIKLGLFFSASERVLHTRMHHANTFKDSQGRHDSPFFGRPKTMPSMFSCKKIRVYTKAVQSAMDSFPGKSSVVSRELGLTHVTHEETMYSFPGKSTVVPSELGLTHVTREETQPICTSTSAVQPNENVCESETRRDVNFQTEESACGLTRPMQEENHPICTGTPAPSDGKDGCLKNQSNVGFKREDSCILSGGCQNYAPLQYEEFEAAGSHAPGVIGNSIQHGCSILATRQAPPAPKSKKVYSYGYKPRTISLHDDRIAGMAVVEHVKGQTDCSGIDDGVLMQFSEGQRFYACNMCTYVNHKRCHAKNHYVRIHLKGGNNMKGKWRYRETSPAKRNSSTHPLNETDGIHSGSRSFDDTECRVVGMESISPSTRPERGTMLPSHLHTGLHDSQHGCRTNDVENEIFGDCLDHELLPSQSGKTWQIRGDAVESSWASSHNNNSAYTVFPSAHSRLSDGFILCDDNRNDVFHVQGVKGGGISKVPRKGLRITVGLRERLLSCEDNTLHNQNGNGSSFGEYGIGMLVESPTRSYETMFGFEDGGDDDTDMVDQCNDFEQLLYHYDELSTPLEL